MSIYKIWQMVVKKILQLGNFQWIINIEEDEADLGIRLFGVNFYYYKYNTSLLSGDQNTKDKISWRPANKHELSLDLKINE